MCHGIVKHGYLSFICDMWWLIAIQCSYIILVRFHVLKLIIILNSVSLQSRVSILKACLRKSPISKVCINAYIEPTPKACLIRNYFLKGFVLLCTLEPVYVSDESHF